MVEWKSALLLYIIAVSLCSFLCLPLYLLVDKQTAFFMDKCIYGLALLGGCFAVSMCMLVLGEHNSWKALRKKTHALLLPQGIFFLFIFLVL